MVPDPLLGVKMLWDMFVACREEYRALPGYRQVGGPSGEWLGPVAAALMNDFWSTEIWLEGPPNSPVGLGSQAMCSPFISVASEIPRGSST